MFCVFFVPNFVDGITVVLDHVRWPAVERVPGLYSALLNSADAMDANDITGVRGPKQSCFVDIEKVRK